MSSHNQGFILLMALLGLFTLCVVTFLLSSMLTATKHASQTPLPTQQDVWLCVHQLERELSDGSNIQITNQQLSFQLNGQTIKYFRSGSRLVRQVDNQGFEIVLLSIDFVSFTKKGQLLLVTVSKEKGWLEEWTFIPGTDV